MISSCGTSILSQCFHDVIAEFHVIVVSEKKHLVAQQFHGFLKFRRIFLSDFADNDAVRGIVPLEFTSEPHGNMVLCEQGICKIVLVVDVHIWDGQDGPAVQSQKIFHRLLLWDSCL